MNTISCPNCGKPIEVSDVLEHQLREKIVTELGDTQKKQWESERKRIEEETSKKIKDQMELMMRSKDDESKEQKERNKILQEQLLELTKQLRKLHTEKEDMTLVMEKKLASEEEKIRNEARKKAEEEQQLKTSEYEKKLQDAIRTNDELKRKLQQGSQQTQGEVLELALEELLKREFPSDDIKPVPKGVRGADVIQEVRDRQGHICGTILWESKNARWSDGWIDKLKEDQRLVKSAIAILLTIELPKELTNAGYMNGVWVTNRTALKILADSLRFGLIKEQFIRQSTVGKNEKMEILYGYLTGVEFRQRIEGIVDAFTKMQDELEREKRWFASKWARQEKSIRMVMDQTYGMYGELQGVTGKALPELKDLKHLHASDEGQLPLDKTNL